MRRRGKGIIEGGKENENEEERRSKRIWAE